MVSKKKMPWKFLGFICSLLLCLSAVFAAETTVLEHCKINTIDDKVTVTLDLTEKPEFHCFLLENPERLVLDLTQTSIKTTLSPTSNFLIQHVRSSDHNHNYLRLVFDLSEPTTFNTSYSDELHHLTIQLHPKKITQGKEKPAASSEPVSLPPEPILRAKTAKNKSFVVVIDPGHGGKDPGAEGPHGTMEKEVVLKISKELQTLLNDEAGFKAVLTRSHDCYLPLRKRLAIARKNHADLFIAIHADAYHHCHASGASVYALSQRGATSEAARWLAEKENESELGGLSEELADKDVILRSVLIDLSQTHTIESSLQIGNTLLRNLGKFTPLHHIQVEQAAFVVLKSPDIPSVLVETGFLSNPNEEEKLQDPDYQHKTALAIKEGVKQYFNAYGMGSTWVTETQDGKEKIASVDRHHSKIKSKKL